MCDFTIQYISKRKPIKLADIAFDVQRKKNSQVFRCVCISNLKLNEFQTNTLTSK